MTVNSAFTLGVICVLSKEGSSWLLFLLSPILPEGELHASVSTYCVTGAASCWPVDLGFGPKVLEETLVPASVVWQDCGHAAGERPEGRLGSGDTYLE